MDGINLMVGEHRNIKRMLKVIRNYADNHHHGTEENVQQKYLDLLDQLESKVLGQ